MRTVVGDDAVWHPEPAHDALDELDGRSNWDGVNGFYLRPFGELVDGDVEVSVAPWRSREQSQDVQPPDREWSCERDCLEAVHGLVDLLGVELACFTLGY